MYISSQVTLKIIKNNTDSLKLKCICSIKQSFFFKIKTICRNNSDIARVWLKQMRKRIIISQKVEGNVSSHSTPHIHFWSAATLPLWQPKECCGHHIKARVAA